MLEIVSSAPNKTSCFADIEWYIPKVCIIIAVSGIDYTIIITVCVRASSLQFFRFDHGLGRNWQNNE